MKLFFLKQKMKKRQVRMVSGLSSVSGQVPQKTDSEAEIHGQSPYPREREGRVLSRQIEELSSKALVTKT